jgi:hypothetical protein
MVTAGEEAMELSEQQTSWLQTGIDNFNTGRFWHAQEDWEELWKSLKPDAESSAGKSTWCDQSMDESECKIDPGYGWAFWN